MRWQRCVWLPPRFARQPCSLWTRPAWPTCRTPSWQLADKRLIRVNTLEVAMVGSMGMGLFLRFKCFFARMQCPYLGKASDAKGNKGRLSGPDQQVEVGRVGWCVLL